MPIQVPTWVVCLGPEATRVVKAFRGLLGDVNLTRAELSRRLELGPSTVGNWASGSKRPTLESMKATVAVLRESLADLQQRTEQMQEVLDLVDANISASDRGRGEPTEAWLAATRRLESALDAMGVLMEEQE